MDNADLLQVRSPILTFFVLKERDELFLIDTGFVTGWKLLQRALKKRGWHHLPIRGVLLTHGHLDHAFNAVRIAREYGCWVAAPRGEEKHCLGWYRYTGLARVTGVLEPVGRTVFRYKPVLPTHLFDDGTMFPIWGGLQAVGLPGHSVGHTGFYCPSRKLLFSGDLFNSYFGLGYRPWGIFNSFPKEIPASIAKACALDLDGVLPNHGDNSTPQVHLTRLRKLNAALQKRA
jgi:glyoxylase-like metal-dependent hydrolase (beta-lactamase superfamily II)